MIAPLGEGGMSQVYLAYDHREPRLVALKVPRETLRNDAAALGRLRREADIYRTLNHPAIVRLLDCGAVDGGGYFLAQEYLRGESLLEVMDSAGGPLELPRAMLIFEDIASALNTAHRANVVHRDVQPENVMVGPDGRGTLFDFGIAYAADNHVRTQAGTLMGTIVYSAPEQRRGDPVDHRSDIWGLGAMLYEMLTGRKAVQAKTYDEALEARSADLPEPSRRNRAVPPELDAICMRMIADEPKDRYPDMRAMLIELGKLRLESDEDAKARIFGTVEKRVVDEAVQAFKEGETDKAEALSKRLEAACPPGMEAELHYLQAQIHVRRGRPDLAIRSFEKAIFNDPTKLDITLDFVFVLLKTGAVEKARTVLDAIPGVARGNLLVLGMVDAIDKLPQAPKLPPPPEAGKGETPGASGVKGLFGSLKNLFKKGE